MSPWREFRRGDHRGELLYETVMAALQEVCLHHAGVYLC